MRDDIRLLIAHRLHRLSPQNCSKATPTVHSEISQLLRSWNAQPSPHIRRKSISRSPIRVKSPVTVRKARSQKDLHPVTLKADPSTPRFRQLTPAPHSLEHLLTLCDSLHDLTAAKPALEPLNSMVSLNSYIHQLQKTPGKRVLSRKLTPSGRKIEEKTEESINVYRHLGKRTLWRIDSRRLLRSTERLLARRVR